MLKAGIVGLPNVGKSTLFNAITNLQVEAANYPFATIEPNSGTVELYDKRLEIISKLVQPQKIIKSTIEFIDIAGLVKGASKGKGLGNKFLSNIREVDVIVEVVRCFIDDNIIHVDKEMNPEKDVYTIDMEFIFSDLETIENILNKISKKIKNIKEKNTIKKYDLAIKIKKQLENELPIRLMFLNDDEKQIIKSWNLLTIKPIIYVGNVEEKYIQNPNLCSNYKNLDNLAKKNNITCIGISAKIESELSQIKDYEEKQMFLKELEINETGFSKLTRIVFNSLNLSTYFTVGKKEVRSWTFTNGMNAPQCAGIIHSDFQRGFIKAEVISYEDFISSGSIIQAKNLGKNRLEGKDYIFKDGDIVDFKFNV